VNAADQFRSKGDLQVHPKTMQRDPGADNEYVLSLQMVWHTDTLTGQCRIKCKCLFALYTCVKKRSRSRSKHEAAREAASVAELRSQL